MTKTLVAHFDNSTAAQKAVDELERAGFTSEDVSYVAHDRSGPLAGSVTDQTEASSGAAKGAAIGGVSGVLLGMAALAIPGIGPILAAGPIVSALAGAGVGAATGGLLGALSGLGVPEQDARRWSDAVGSGGSLVIVRAGDDRIGRARSVLDAQSPAEIGEHEPRVQESGGFDASDPHASNANYGDEGGSSQWSQTVLRPDRVADRTVSRDADPVKGDEWSRGHQ